VQAARTLNNLFAHEYAAAFDLGAMKRLVDLMVGGDIGHADVAWRVVSGGGGGGGGGDWWWW
jgi:hypothetical protein